MVIKWLAFGFQYSECVLIDAIHAMGNFMEYGSVAKKYWSQISPHFGLILQPYSKIYRIRRHNTYLVYHLFVLLPETQRDVSDIGEKVGEEKEC